MPQQLTKVVKDELKADVHVRVVGKTLWIFVPMDNLIDEQTAAWQKSGLETLNKIMNVAHRVILSTDAPVEFLAVAAADVKKFGVELLALEYIQDLREAVLEKFSRGEYFMRSIRDVRFNPLLIGDILGENRAYHDITFEEFISMQIIHRAKNIFAKDKTLSPLFELKTTSWTEKFGILKIEFEFVRKKYDLSPEEEKINPLETVTMITAQTIRNYDFKDIQAVELTDTFSKETVKLSLEELGKVQVKLPEYTE
ncbi:MAG: hypothetical protein WC732_08340 [Candidatus Omnitrophota bacterium]